MSNRTTDEICSVCHKPKSQHDGMRHIFVSDTDKQQGLRPSESSAADASSTASKSQGSISGALRGDPVLRLLLIRKGVITPDELTGIEDELRATGLASVAPTRLG